MEPARGQLLIAGPSLLDPNFWRTVVLVVEHNEEGALGLVVNRASETSVGEAVPQLEQLIEPHDPIFIGGPVQPSAVMVLAGAIASSLALLSDAAHMTTDAAALALAVFAARLASRPASGSMTYGLGRAEILSAQANGVTLLVLAGVIAYEAVTRLITPPAVRGGVVLGVALAGIVVNLLVAEILRRASPGRRSLNVE